jgi:hypothetical protein
MITANELWPQLEALGEDDVCKRLAEGVYGPMKESIVRGWLAMKDAQRAEAREREQRASDRETIRVAEESNAIGARSNRITWYGIVIALVSALVALINR